MSEQTKKSFNILDNERLDDLVRGGLRIIQKPGSFCFSIDAVLLANFASVKKGDLVVDLCTGSGVIPLLITTRQCVNQIVGIEIQEEMVDRAARSVSGNGLQEFIRIRHGDVRNISAELGRGKFDLVTANPPYMPVDKGKISPSDTLAISRHELYCTVDDIIREGSKLLNSHGRMALVHRPNRLVDITYNMRKFGLEPKRLQLVYPSVDKKPNIVLVEAIKGGKPELEIMNPLFVYNKEGEYTEELMNIYYPGR